MKKVVNWCCNKLKGVHKILCERVYIDKERVIHPRSMAYSKNTKKVINYHCIKFLPTFKISKKSRFGTYMFLTIPPPKVVASSRLFPNSTV